MQKQPQRKFVLEFRNYLLPSRFPAAALLRGRFRFPELGEKPDYMHFHNCTELGYYARGSSRLTVEGRTFRVQEGDLILIPPYASHITFRDGEAEDPEVEYFYTDPLALLEGLPGLGSVPIAQFQHSSPDFPFVLSAGTYGRPIAIFRRILEEMRAAAPFYEEAVRGLVLQFWIELIRLRPETMRGGNALRAQGISRLAAAVAYINDHYTEHISPQHLADLCFMSLTTFRRLFRRSVGTSPFGYVRLVRIRRAQALLLTTEKSMLEISLEVGFDSPSSFNRHFSEIAGTSPLKWRNARRAVEKKGVVRSDYTPDASSSR